MSKATIERETKIKLSLSIDEAIYLRDRLQNAPEISEPTTAEGIRCWMFAELREALVREGEGA